VKRPLCEWTTRAVRALSRAASGTLPSGIPRQERQAYALVESERFVRLTDAWQNIDDAVAVQSEEQLD
jgi:hypothetical protein